MFRHFTWFALAALACAQTLLAQSLVDPTLSVETWASNLGSATSITFLPGASDALITQKDTGRVLLMHNRKITRTVLDLPVNSDSERGLLGITLHPQYTKNHYVYLYYTLAKTDGGDPIANRIARYTLNKNRLTFNRVIKNLPATPGPNHNGGKILFGPDKKLYAVIGDLNRRERTENTVSSRALSDTGVVLRLNDNGSSPRDNPFYSASNARTSRAPLNDIYAYGVRNSFGLTFDPLSKRLWESENGVDTYDEINQINPGFNGGWTPIMGPRSRVSGSPRLVRLGKNARYTDPQFSWATVVAPVATTFLSSSALGGTYQNDLFVGDYENGDLFNFSLTANRRSLVLAGPLADRVADNTAGNLEAEQGSIIFGRGFGIATDLVSRPDGLYVLSLDKGALYRITRPAGAPLPEPGSAALLALAATGLLRRWRA